MNEILEKLYEATLRVERTIYLAGALSDSSLPDDLNDFLDDEDVVAECLGDIPDWVDLAARPVDRGDWVCEWLMSAGRFGYLVQFATPVMTPHSATSRSFSWGYYSTKWVYAETMEEAIDKGLAWAEERRAKEDSKAGLALAGPGTGDDDESVC